MRLAIPLFSILAWLSSSHLYSGTLVSTYGTYFGGTGDNNAAAAVALDGSGNIIVVGTTTSQTLPGTANAFQPMKAVGFPDNQNVYIAKFNPTGQVLLWASFLGGDLQDRPTSIAVDAGGNVYVVGITSSATFPVTPAAYQGAAVPDTSTGFASKISADGKTLLYSTYLPGSPNALAVSSAGEAYVAGLFAATVITPGALGAIEAGDGPFNIPPGGVYLLRLNSTGTGLVFGAYLGGGGFNSSSTTSVGIDQQGNAYVAGYTRDNQDNVLTTANAFQGQLPAGIIANPNFVSAGFVVEVNSIGSQVVYGTYFGPPYSSTQIASLAVAPDGSLLFSGAINTTAMWATPGAYLATPSPGFVAKLTPGKTTLDAFTFVDTGGSSPTILSAELSNQPQQLYIGFYSGNAPEIAELNVPNLSLASSYSLPQGASAGFAAAALAPPNSLWVAGFCNPCALGNLIPSNAFQSSPQTSNATFLIQLTNISPTILFTGSAATGTSPFAAGQLVSIYGTQLGPVAGSGPQIGPDGAVTTRSGGTQVLFDGVATPILYAGAGQVNTVIPCSTAGKSSTQMVVDYMGAQSAPLTVALSRAAPGIFTDNGSGTGQGAVLNQDYSLNGPSNPASRGSIAIFYATGVGPTSPCVDGKIYQSNFPTLTLPVIVGVGHTGAHVLYAGQAPDIISGVAQFNVVIPNDAPSGAVPLTLVVGGIFSPSGVTISVK